MTRKTVALDHTSAVQHGLGKSHAEITKYGPHLVKVLGVRSEMSVYGPRDRKIATIAAAQRGRVSRAQLRAAAVSPSQISLMIRRHWLHRLHDGVYAVGHLGPMPLGAETAALLSVPGSVLSHQSAAELWNLCPADGETDLVHILVARDCAKSRRGVRVHRTRCLEARDLRIREGLPVTSPARALLDIADSATDRQLERGLDQALVRRVMSLADLEDVLSRTSGRAGASRLSGLLRYASGAGPTRSEAEERLLELIRAAGLPEPRTNVRVEGFEVDFYWPTERFVLEVDGFQFHSTRAAFERDRRRDATLRAAGVATMRVTWRQLEQEPYAVIARLAQALTWARARES